ncbi:MAG TPA: sensor histidine kinase [Armatimonadota bacterium]|nr:sensor histidine kinase [Armatimonadota bacterium]
MGVRAQGRREQQLSLYDEAQLLTRLSERQTDLVFDLLSQAAESSRVFAENARLTRDLAGSFDRLQEVHHRIRNHLQTVTGLLSAQEIEEKSPTARRALHKSVGRLSSIAAIHDLLARDPASGELRIPELAQQLSRHLLRHTGAEHRLHIRTDVSPFTLGTKEATAFVLILTELLSNAIEHAFTEDAIGEVGLRAYRDADEAVLEVRDNGRGLPADFTFEQTEGLGLRLVWRLAERDLNGSIAAYNDTGACFRLTFPIRKTEGHQ